MTNWGRASELPLTLEQGRALAASGVVTAVPSPYRPGSGWSARPGRSARPGSATSSPHQAEGRDRPAAVPPRLRPARRRLAAGHGARRVRPRTWCPSSPRRCGGRPNGPSTRACCPATSSSRKARRCCAAGCARASSCIAITGCRSRWRSGTTSSPSTSPENQILRTACERMLSVPRVDAESAADAAAAAPRLRRRHGDSPRRSGPAWQPTRLNARYHAALRLARTRARAPPPSSTMPGTSR